MSNTLTDIDGAQPSPAHKPDLDWSQVRETVRMLNVAIAQIRNSMTEGDDSINSLTASFTGIVERMQKISAIAVTIPDPTKRVELQAVHTDITGKIDEAIISFQFYDKLTQRLNHIETSLDQLSRLVDDNQRLYNPAEWHALQERIKAKYTVEADRRMFEVLLAGATVEEAVSASRLLKNSGASDATEIELF